MFEDNPNKHKAIIVGGAARLSSTSLPITDLNAKKSISGSTTLTEMSQDSKDLTLNQQNSTAVNYESMARVFQLDKLQHYIEVGFTIDKRSYRFCESYKEKAYNSTLTKYLFEFIVDKFSNEDLVKYQKLIKT